MLISFRSTRWISGAPANTGETPSCHGKDSSPTAATRGARVLHGCSTRATEGPRTSACVSAWRRKPLPAWCLIGNDWVSHSTAIGNSSDRPVALAELIGILVNDGVRRPNTELSNIHFARGTPYETVFERKPEPGQQVLVPEVARAARKAMAAVVESGTARRLAGVFRL